MARRGASAPHTPPSRSSARGKVMGPIEIGDDIRTAATLPAEFYREPAYFALARERVFLRSWQLVLGADPALRELSRCMSPSAGGRPRLPASAAERSAEF